MLPLLLAVALGQSTDVRSPVAVVLTSKRPGTEVVAPQVARLVFDALMREKVDSVVDDPTATKQLKEAGFSDPKSCQGTRGCLSRLAVLLSAHAVVVGVDVAKIGKTLAIHLEAIAADKEASLATLDVSASMTNWGDMLAAPIVTFTREMKDGLPLPPKQPVAATTVDDTPRRTKLEPPVAAAQPALVTKPSEPRSRVVPWVLVGGAVAAAGGAAALGVVSGNAQTTWKSSLVTLPDGSAGTRLTEPDARALAGTANTTMVMSIGAGVLSAALAATATVLLLKD